MVVLDVWLLLFMYVFQNVYKNTEQAVSNLEQVLVATSHKTPTVRPPASYHENYSS